MSAQGHVLEGVLLVSTGPGSLSQLKLPALACCPTCWQGPPDGASTAGLMHGEDELHRWHQGCRWVHCRGRSVVLTPGQGELWVDMGTWVFNGHKLNSGDKEVWGLRRARAPVAF